MPTSTTPFGVTLRNDLEQFLPTDTAGGRAQEEAILDVFSRIAGGEPKLGFPIHPSDNLSSSTAKPPAAAAPSVAVLRSQTPAITPASVPSRAGRTPQQDEIWERDHGQLPLSRLRPLAHPGIWDLSDPSQIPTICKQLDGRKFTYVIVGGGTAGMVLANRLTEDPENFVCVLEAGSLQTHDPDIQIPNMEFKAWNTDLDWQYKSVPQEELGGRMISWPRGKLVGGCSNLNIAVMNRAPRIDYDAWEKLGNEGWNWKELLEYHRRSETFHVPTPAKNLDPHTAHDPIWKPHAHGHDGPLQVSYTPYVSPAMAGLYDALREEGLKERDPNGGSPDGVGYVPATVDPRSQTRSSAEAAYLAPIAHRENLFVVTNAQATQLVWSSRSLNAAGGLVKAKEVEFFDPKKPEERYYARFMDEVVLCGGSFNSPQLLELSGIGDKHHLESLGIDSVVDLPGVGENLQDHPVVAMSFKLKPEYKSLDVLESDKAFAEQTLEAYSHLEGPLTQGCPVLAYLSPHQFLSEIEFSHAESLLHVKNDRYGERFEIASTPGGKKQLKVEQENYSKRAAMEIIAMNKYLGGAPFKKGASYIGVIAGHITSDDPLKKPRVDPRYLSHPLDVYHLALAARFLHGLCTNPNGALAEYLDLEHAKAPPLPESLLHGDPDVGGEEGWEDYVKNHCSTEHHPSATCSMLPREDGGVVDPSLKVYGTSNVRIADMSIIPLHLATHTQSTAYMIGEKCSDIMVDAQMQRRHGY
ncbi:hypothetical protein JCM10213v2_002114 [Rhodosporidiobolus nylandii]